MPISFQTEPRTPFYGPQGQWLRKIQDEMAECFSQVNTQEGDYIEADQDLAWTGSEHSWSNTTSFKVGDLGIIGNTGKDLLLRALVTKGIKFQVDDANVLTITGSLATLAQVLKVPDGSVGTPGLHFAGDTNTGFGLISSKLAAIFNGSVVMDSDGTTLDCKAQNLTTMGLIQSLDAVNPSIFKSGVKFKDSGTGSDTHSSRVERGIWTPALSYLTVGSSSWTFTNQVGVYTKWDKWVTCTGLVTWSAHTKGTGASLLQMSLPFISNTTANKYWSGSCIVATGITAPTSAGMVQSSHIQPNFSQAFFSSFGPSSGLFWSTASAGFVVASAGTMIMTIEYEAST